MEAALREVGELAGTKLEAQSRIHASEPVGGPPGQGTFANAAAVVHTSLTPDQLLQSLQAIETKLGRERLQRWAARAIDIDLLLVEQQVIDSPQLVVPHPRMSFRPFVLEPAIEVAEDWRHPQLGKTLRELCDQLKQGDDSLAVDALQRADRDWLVDWLGQNAPKLKITSSPSDSKLTIGFYAAGEPMRPGGPTLRLTGGSREETLFEVEAALDCVWPGWQSRFGSRPV